MQLPEGVKQPRRTENTLVKALARAFRWKRMLDLGEFANIAELAEREGIAPSYMTRVLRLTLLAPDIVEAILDGTQGPEVTLARVLEPFPLAWGQQDPHFSDVQHHHQADDLGAAVTALERVRFGHVPTL
jgi:hypothetical protein